MTTIAQPNLRRRPISRRRSPFSAAFRAGLSTMAISQRWFMAPLVAFAVTRIIIFTAGYLAEIALPGNEGPAFLARAGNLLLDLWARFDSGFYLGIIDKGYAFDASGGMSNVAFFPIYPLLANLTNLVVRDTVFASIIVSNLCLLGALLYLYKLTELEFGDAGTAQRAVFYIAAFPTAFFFSAVYTESAFLLFSVATMYYARRHQWLMAGLMGMITSATHRWCGHGRHRGAGVVARAWLDDQHDAASGSLARVVAGAAHGLEIVAAHRPNSPGHYQLHGLSPGAL